MQMKIFLRALPLVALYFSSMTYASTPLLETPVTYHPNAGVEERVKSECQIEAMLAEQVGNQLKRVFRADKAVLEKGDDPAGSPLLRLQITHVLGVGGGAWTGPKAITVSAELLGSDGQVRRTKINRWSVGGAFGGFRGTCSILERCAVSIGKDLARWVKDPSFKIKEIPAPPEAGVSKATESVEAPLAPSEAPKEVLQVPDAQPVAPEVAAPTTEERPADAENATQAPSAEAK